MVTALDAAGNQIAAYEPWNEVDTGIMWHGGMDALLDFSRRTGVWIISDEVYEDYVYSGEHTYCRPLAPEHTFAAHSFSKAYGMAGILTEVRSVR